jgi:flagellum-specific peptidoglycan hydrolase FlgJ
MARAGYATDPGYAQRIIAIMKKYKLTRYNKR